MKRQEFLREQVQHMEASKKKDRKKELTEEAEPSKDTTLVMMQKLLMCQQVGLTVEVNPKYLTLPTKHAQRNRENSQSQSLARHQCRNGKGKVAQQKQANHHATREAGNHSRISLLKRKVAGKHSKISKTKHKEAGATNSSNNSNSKVGAASKTSSKRNVLRNRNLARLTKHNLRVGRINKANQLKRNPNLDGKRSRSILSALPSRSLIGNRSHNRLSLHRLKHNLDGSRSRLSQTKHKLNKLSGQLNLSLGGNHNLRRPTKINLAGKRKGSRKAIPRKRTV